MMLALPAPGRACLVTQGRRRKTTAIATAMNASRFACGASSSGEALSQESGDVDALYMQECVALARTALGKTDPNPMVGCVLVKDGKVLGRGFHPKAGEPHAEIFALRDAGLSVSAEGGAQEWTVAGSSAQGATAYVSLEPCNHVGRTPPCSRALVAAGVARVVVGMVDPDPRVSGGGIKTLESAGIQVDVGVEQAQCRQLIQAFIDRVTQQSSESK